MKLSDVVQLLDAIGVLRSIPTGLAEVEVHAVVSDSRQVRPGMLFIAIPGYSVDGHQFISQAIHNGAIAVIGEKEISSLPVPYFTVSNARIALAYLLAAWHGFPARKMTVIGVTGTDGKTTTCHFIYQILKTAGYSVGMISTVNALVGEETIDTGFHVTTPDAPSLQTLLAKMVGYESAPITHVVLETTSHGLAQHRVAACEYDIGVFTNVTHEHLDFHGSYENYLAAKARLIEELAKTVPKPWGNRRLAVLNCDDQSFAFLRNYARDFPSVEVISYGRNCEAEIRAVKVEFVEQCPRFFVLHKGQTYAVQLQLMGEYNVHNALAAWGATVEGLGIPPEVAVRGLEDVRAIPGRMEKIELGQPFLAIVDFAHTPHALRNALMTARELALGGRVIAVFGSAGLRDREKRWLMAEIGSRLADICILTAEDPRTETVEEILSEMKKGAERGGGQEGVTYFRIADRREAIRLAVRMAAPGDVVLVLGKGHEQSMCFGVIEYPWDDRVALRSAIAEQLGIPGPTMPYLPS